MKLKKTSKIVEWLLEMFTKFPLPMSSEWCIVCFVGHFL